MRINILLPVYNDWDNLELLLNEIEKIKNNKVLNISSIDITAVNDFSTTNPKFSKNFKKFNINILNLSKNVGSQLAINTGLSYLDKNKENFDYCVIMDSDGEDKAEDIITLLKAAQYNENKIVFASRGKRQDGYLFFLLYKIYLIIFSIFTGKIINFGNFSCIPKNLINSVKNLDNSQIHHSASILESNLPFIKIKCDRGKRFMGKSKMSLKNLIFHGINGISIFFDLILKRFLILSLILITIIFILNFYIENFIWVFFDNFKFMIILILVVILSILIFLKIIKLKFKNLLKKKRKSLNYYIN